MSTESPATAKVTRHFRAAPERVFDAWLDAEAVAAWMFPAESDEVVRVAVDARVGGSFSFVVRRGDAEIDHTGEYLEIDRPRRLAFTWGIAGEEGADRVTVDVAASDGGCELTLTHELHPDWTEYAGRAEAAWASMLDSLAATLDEEEPMRHGTEDHGAATAPGVVRIERLLPGPVERIWAYLTESERRGRWLAPGKMELRVGGRVELRFRHADLSAETQPPERYAGRAEEHLVHGTVTRCEPPRLLAYTWSGAEDSEVTFELTPRDADVLLVVTHRRLRSRREMTGVAAGWHAHLGILADRLAGREPRGFWSAHDRLEAEYAERFAEAGAEPHADAVRP